MKTLTVLGYPVHVGTLASLLAAVEEGLRAGRHLHVVTLNPEMLMRGESEPDFSRILKAADLVLPDGAGVVWALKRKRVPVQRIPGIEFSQALIAQAACDNEPIAMIGAQPEVIAAAKASLERQYPGLNVCFEHHGFFASEEDRAQVAQRCAAARPRYVFVALGVPGQENWIDEFKPLFSQPTVFVGVGGSFDIWSGLKRRAHPLFLKLNLEWLWRITSEPFRLKRVYKTLPMFVVKVLLHDNGSMPTEPTVKRDEYGHAEPNTPHF